MARTSEKLKLPIGVVFTTSNRSNSKVKIKIFKNKEMDELLDANFVVPGISSKAVIKDVVVGNSLIEKVKSKYNLK